MEERRLIDANALRQKIEKWAASADNSTSFTDSVEGFAYDEVLDAIDTAPTINPETLRPVARWEPVDPKSDIKFKCSKCEGVISTDWDGSEYFEYCPYCGARAGDSI